MTPSAQIAQRNLAKTGIFYSMMRIGDTVLWDVISNWQNYYYFPPDGVALVPVGWLYGLLMFANAAIGTVIALPIGHWSDRTRTRWGRRLPFMFVGGLPRLIFFMLLWTPPFKTTSTVNLIYLTTFLIAHSVAATFQQVPSEALFPELGETDQERVKITAWAGMLQPLAMILSSFAGLGIAYLGYVKTVGLYALIALPLFYLPFLVLRERPAAPPPPSAKPATMRQSLQLIAQNRIFLRFTAIRTLSMSGGILVRSMFPFVITELLLLTTADTVYFYIAGIVTMLLAYPLTTHLAGRWGKQRVFALSLLGSALVMPFLSILGAWMPIPLIVPGLLWAALLALTTTGSGALETAFIAEIIDYDAAVTGHRREGAYYATLEIMDRIVYSSVAMIPPILLILGRGAAGPRGPIGVRLAGLIGGVCMLTALALFRGYKLPKIAPSPAESAPCV